MFSLASGEETTDAAAAPAQADISSSADGEGDAKNQSKRSFGGNIYHHH